MKSLFVMDPIERLRLVGDSTYVTMRELTDRGMPCWMCTPEGVYAEDGRARAHAHAVRALHDAPWFDVKPVTDHDLEDFDVVWMRKDPPFDMRYILTTYLLDMAPPETLVVNAPVGLKVFNEKFWAMRFPDLHPPTLLARDPAQLRARVEAIGGRAVLKPWDGNAGRGVIVTSPEDRNLASITEVLTRGGTDYVLCQPFLPGVEDGDKRILLFDGEPVGAMLRVPQSRDFRGNVHAGAELRGCDLDERDHEICATLGPELRRWGQVFVGIDVIEGFLTEINITSPSGIREINELCGKALHRDLVDCVQVKLTQHRAAVA